MGGVSAVDDELLPDLDAALRRVKVRLEAAREVKA